MALVLKDRVRETSTTTGTGTFTLSGAVTGFQSFSAIGTGNTTYYTIAMGAEWEVGVGTWTSPNQLSRDTVYESSNSNALVPFSAGTKDVFVTFPAEAVTSGGGSGTVTQVNTSGSVSGITLTGGPITTTGTVTLGGTLDLSSPPAIGGTTPNTITGTTITANTQLTFPTVTLGNSGFATFKMEDYYLDGFDYLVISSDDGFGTPTTIIINSAVQILGGLGLSGGLTLGGELIATQATFSNGLINLYDNTSGNYLTLKSSSTTGAYTLTFPTTAGSNNQVLKTDGSGNTSWTDKFVLGAGTATAGTAPLKFTSGTNLTTAEAGAMEYDGKVAYFTPSNTSRALLPSPYVYRKNTATTLASATGNQAIFGLTSGVTVAANTIYEIECEFQLSTSGTTSHTEAFGFTLTTATVTNMGVAVNRLAGNTTSTALGTYLTSVTPVVVTGALTTAQVGIYRVKGTIAFGTGGSINPVIAFSAAPGGTSSIILGAWMKMTPIGTTGSNVSIGTWA